MLLSWTNTTPNFKSIGSSDDDIVDMPNGLLPDIQSPKMIGGNRVKIYTDKKAYKWCMDLSSKK